MRITGGEARGKKIKIPSLPSVRPTSERVREAIFSSLEHLLPRWGSVLDLFAGSGALGLEALSRGAEEADFVDRDPRCCKVIRENLKLLGFEERGRVWCMDVRKAVSCLSKKYDLIFLDPPYDLDPRGILEEIGRKLAKEKTIIILEHSKHLKPPERFDNFLLARRLSHGDTEISFYEIGDKEGFVSWNV